ncbi:hypothetical protein [Pseudomonas peli]|uniref:hypothetical protein n=1 Tax=Pseudomonas peli TaxID=592361 RepID=UPI0024AD39EF|nr:hypothetical protein [Pseudomonas peli]
MWLFYQHLKASSRRRGGDNEGLQAEQRLAQTFSQAAQSYQASQDSDVSTMPWTGGATTYTDTSNALTAGNVGSVLTFTVSVKNGAAVTGSISSLDTTNAPGVSGCRTTPPEFDN